MSTHMSTAMSAGQRSVSKKAIAEKKQSKRSEADGDKKYKKKTTKEHFAQQAAVAKYKLKKSASQGNGSPWIVGERYQFKIPEDNFEHVYQLDGMGRVFVTFEDANSSKIAFVINIVIMFVLVISCIQYVVQSLPSVQYQPDDCVHPVCDNDNDLCPGRVVCEPIPPDWFEYLEMACVIVFTVDYIARVASCSYVPARISGVIPVNLSLENPSIDDPEFEIIERYRDPEYEELWWVSIYRYMLQPLNVIDLVAVIPFYVELVFSSGSSLSIIRILRLARVIRLAKSGKGRFTKGLKILSNTLITSAPMNAFLLAVALIIFVVCGAIGFLIEGGEFKVSQEYPDGAYMRTDLLGEHLEPTPFLSVLHGMYWSVVTSTTVGYGDLYATTAGGRIFACACTFLGIIVIAMPVTVLGTHFSKEYEREYMASDEIEAVKRESVRRLSMARISQSFMSDTPLTASSSPTRPRLGSFSSFNQQLMSPEVRHAEASVVRLEAMAAELQRSILEIRCELDLHKDVIRKASAAILNNGIPAANGDCSGEISAASSSDNMNGLTDDGPQEGESPALSPRSGDADLGEDDGKPESMSIVSGEEQLSL